jgi:riboflavin transporter
MFIAFFMEAIMRLNRTNRVQKISLIGILAGLGAVLMAFIQIPYPPVPFLRIEFSDVVVLLAFLIYGWKEAAFVGLLKALVNALVLGPVGPIAIGQISAFIASMSYVLGLALVLKYLVRTPSLVRGILIVSLVTSVMVGVNYFFVTPIYFGAWTYLGVREWLNLSSFGLSGTGSYLWTIVVVYTPFNILKGIAVMTVYFIVAKAVIAFTELESKPTF